MNWLIRSWVVLLAVFGQLPCADASAGTPRSAGRSLPVDALRSASRAAPLKYSLSLYQNFEAASSPACPQCSGPWRVAMHAAMLNEAPLLDLRLVHPLWAGTAAGDARWHLGLAAHALVSPGERRVVAALCRVQRNSRLQAGLEAIEAELLPVAEQPFLPKRFVRRSGAMVAWHLHSHARMADTARPTMRPRGITLGGTLRLWQAMAARPVLDSQLRMTLGTNVWGPAHLRQQLWADLGWRGLVGSDDRLVAVGGWQVAGPLGAGRHVLKERMMGYEDTVRYTARTVHAQAGTGAQLGRHGRMDVFAAATQIDTLAHQPARWLRSIGARLNMTPPGRRGMLPQVSYQVARRFDGSRGPWLHMLTASL